MIQITGKYRDPHHDGEEDNPQHVGGGECLDRIRRDPQHQLVDEIERGDFIGRLPGRLLRISAQAYNDEGQYEQLADALGVLLG